MEPKNNHEEEILSIFSHFARDDSQKSSKTSQNEGNFKRDDSPSLDEISSQHEDLKDYSSTSRESPVIIEDSDDQLSQEQQLPTFEESFTKSSKKDHIKEAFETAFSVGKRFRNMDEFELQVHGLAKLFNTLIVRRRSDPQRYLKLICTHGGSYRSGKGEVNELKTTKKRQNRRTHKSNCTFFMHAKVVDKITGEVEITERCYDHEGHPLSDDIKQYAKYRKLSAEDLQLAISMINDGKTPQEVLNVSIFNLSFYFGKGV